MTHTFEQIKDAVNEHGKTEIVQFFEFARSPYPKLEVEDLGEIEFVDAKFGAEGGGEDIWFVFKFEDTLYRFTGYYSSYDGENWDDYSDLEEVAPRETIVIVYDSI